MFFRRDNISCYYLSMYDLRYSDAKYEILPITSGYRWVLIYDLATPFSPEKPLGNIFLREVMKSWARPKKPGDTRPVYYALSDEYSQAILSLVIMKSRDRLCVEESMSAGQDLGFHIFLATLQCLDNHCTFQNTYWNHTYVRYHRYNNRSHQLT